MHELTKWYQIVPNEIAKKSGVPWLTQKNIHRTLAQPGSTLWLLFDKNFRDIPLRRQAFRENIDELETIEF